MITLAVMRATRTATRAQARPVAVAERDGHSGSRAPLTTAPLLPAAVPVRSGSSSEGPVDLFWRASRLNCLMGVQLGGGSTRRQGHLGWFAGAAAAVRELPGSSGRLSPCLPDDGAPRCGCRRPVLACSSIPADRGHRFRRSGARTGHAARAAPPLFACGMPTRAALVVLAWLVMDPRFGDVSPEWVFKSLGHSKSPYLLFSGMRDRHLGAGCR
jgi:hypothetical protein